MQKNLDSADTGLTREEYLGICAAGFLENFVFFILFSTTFFYLLRINNVILLALGFSVLVSFFILSARLSYPKFFINRKQRDIEANLISSLEDILVQLNSGIPLFNILVNISTSDYGALSYEFKKIVKRISAGQSEVDVLEQAGEENPSNFFRRTLWQVSNGMRFGSDISIIIKGALKSLNDEQLVQIQNYGNKLNPAIMFYMLSSVILPALSITFLTILSSMINLPSTITTILFVSLFVFVVIIQVVFLGVIKSIRPSLL